MQSNILLDELVVSADNKRSCHLCPCGEPAGSRVHCRSRAKAFWCSCYSGVHMAFQDSHNRVLARFKAEFLQAGAARRSQAQ
jgi:hypothetical protein